MHISAQVEPFSSFAEELGSLPQQHQSEADLLNAEFPRVVNPAIFYNIERTGMLLCVTLRADGKLIGYAGGVVSNDPQRTKIDGSPVKIFSETGIFVDYEYRGHGLSMTRLLINAAKERGAEIIYLRGPAGSRAARLFNLLGFEPVEMTYAMVVKKDCSDA